MAHGQVMYVFSGEEYSVCQFLQEVNANEIM